MQLGQKKALQPEHRNHFDTTAMDLLHLLQRLAGMAVFYHENIKLARAFLYTLCSTDFLEENMVTGLVLVRLMAGKEKQALAKIKETKGVAHMSAVFGRWDLVLDMETEDLAELSNVVVHNIRSIPGVLSTESLVTTAI